MVKHIKIDSPGQYLYRLQKPGQAIEVVGRFEVIGDERLEVSVKVVHAAERTQSRISLKATVNDRAHACIRGNVVVEEAGRDTDSFLEERVLLLSAKATAEAVPNLEIKTNEVKCSHAATIGPIEANQVFYLTSRGIPEAEAKKMIAEGFLAL